MKAITISQPYASLIATGAKFVENRTWSTSYRGPIAIHAGKGMQYLTRVELAKYATGKVIAIADLVDCLRYDALHDAEYPYRALAHRSFRTISEVIHHKYTEGPWCWILEGVVRIEPIEAKGMQQIWNWDNPEVVNVL